MVSSTKSTIIHGHDPVDLHIHTTASDGTWTPASLVDHANELGLKVIAAADHDVVDMVFPTAQAAQEKGLISIPAIEVTVKFDSCVQHLLLYNFDTNNRDVEAVLTDLRQRQHESARRGLETLRQRGWKLAKVEQVVGDGLLLPVHVAGALLYDHHAHDFDEAIAIGISVGISFDIAANMERMIEAGHRAGGIAILAHPGREEYGMKPATTQHIERMLEIGLDGLEVYHALHSKRDIECYGQFAREHNLLVSCGSDSHGPKARTTPIPWPAQHCAALLERCGIRVIS